MLEAKLVKATILKKLLSATKKLVAGTVDSAFNCTKDGISFQALDHSYMVLVSINLDHKLFNNYKCDKPMFFGMNLKILGRALTCAMVDDVCTLKINDDVDLLNVTYETKNAAEYEMKLVTDIDADLLGIPETSYDAKITMSASEFTHTIRKLSQLGESVRIEVSKEGVRFASEQTADGCVLFNKVKTTGEDESDGNLKVKIKEEDESEGKVRFKQEKDEDQEGKEQKEFKHEFNDEDAGKRTHELASKPSKTSEEQDAIIELSMTFPLKYLVHITKASSLSTHVSLLMGNVVPLLVMYEFEHGYVRYYLAPSIYCT